MNTNKLVGEVTNPNILCDVLLGFLTSSTYELYNNLLGNSSGGIMRLNGWQRIGLVLSVLWALGAGIHERNKQANAANELFQSQYRMCLEQADPVKNCNDTVSLQAAMDATAYWPNVAFYAFGPVIAGWFVVLITIRTFRWVSDGFSKKHE